MGYCSDSRVDPFNAVTQYKTITEIHVIPMSEPYYVRLGEVAYMDSPSSLLVKDYSGATFTEVANIPGKGEVFPDYYNEFDKKNLASGTLLFNRADAGKVITVTYKSMGSLVQSLSNRRSRYIIGRGSGSLGNVRISKDVTMSGVYDYESLIIDPGVTITIDSYCVIRCCEAFINQGTIRAKNGAVLPVNDNLSGSSNFSDKYSTPNSWYAYTTSDVPASKGGISATYGYRRTYHVYPVRRYANANNVWQYGSLENYILNSKGVPRILGLPGLQGACGGQCGVVAGTGGYGGGSIAIFAKEILNLGTVDCNGYDGGAPQNQWYDRYGYVIGGGSGGNGGSIIFVGSCISNKGVLTVKGGLGGRRSWKGYTDEGETHDSILGITYEQSLGKPGESGIIYTLTV